MTDEQEFLRHVYNPVTDASYMAGSHSSPEISLIDSMISSDKRLGEEIFQNPETIDVLRLLVAKTKTQIRTDLSLVFRDTRSPEGADSLCGCSSDELTTHTYDYFKNFISGNRRSYAEARSAAETMGAYFERQGVEQVLSDFQGLGSAARARILDNSILPHDQRGSRSKRQGHGVEAELARILTECGIDVTPSDKTQNPMAGDITFNGMSYDLLIENNGKVEIALISLFHTSNPGQYGADKTEKTEQYAESLASSEASLWAFCDGAGFTMHNGALHNVIDNVDNFVQVKSLWKLPLHLHESGVITLKGVTFSDFYDADDHRRFRQALSIDFGKPDSDATPVDAGEATLWL